MSRTDHFLLSGGGCFDVPDAEAAGKKAGQWLPGVIWFHRARISRKKGSYQRNDWAAANLTEEPNFQDTDPIIHLRGISSPLCRPVVES
jgi:hypothetical protein